VSHSTHLPSWRILSEGSRQTAWETISKV